MFDYIRRVLQSFGICTLFLFALSGCSSFKKIYTEPANLPDAIVGQDYYQEMRFGDGGPAFPNAFFVDMTPEDIGVKWKPYGGESSKSPITGDYLIFYGTPIKAGKVNIRLSGLFKGADGGYRDKDMTIVVHPE